MTNRINQTLWDKRAKRYLQRGRTGFGLRIAQSELKCAAELWKMYCENLSGWAVDFGSGSGSFWDYVNPPSKLLLSDLSKEYKNSKSPSLRIVSDVTIPPIEDDSIKCIVALGLIEYLPDLNSQFRTFRRLSKSDGLFLLSNSPPICANKIRSYLMSDVLLRSDIEVKQSLNQAGWSVLSGTLRHAGLQTLMLAKAN